MWIVNGVLLLILIFIWGQILFRKFRIKRIAKVVKEEEFCKVLQKAQIVDVRERASFERSHILGARNLPISGFKDTMSALRKDKPVYLYEDREILAGRAAILLHKAGFKELYILRKGYSAWTGKKKLKK